MGLHSPEDEGSRILHQHREGPKADNLEKQRRPRTGRRHVQEATGNKRREDAARRDQVASNHPQEFRSRKERVQHETGIFWFVHPPVPSAARQFHSILTIPLSSGRQVLALESTRAIMVSPIDPTQKPIEDSHGRQPFEHLALTNVDKLNTHQPQELISITKVAKLAHEVGMMGVVRWKPRLVCSPRCS